MNYRGEKMRFILKIVLIFLLLFLEIANAAEMTSENNKKLERL